MQNYEALYRNIQNYAIFRCGRSEDINDLWIAGEFDPSKIKCDPFAKSEAERLAKESQIAIESSFFTKDYAFITFLNARSLRKHQIDIMNDPELMKSSLLGIAETHLHVDEDINLDGFEGYFVNSGKGKGVAAFTKITPHNITKIFQTSFSAILLEFEKLRIVFAYMSSQTRMNEVNIHLRPLFQDRKKPTIIMGDMNYHFSEKQNALKSYLEGFGFHQIIERITHDEGHTIDHIYTENQNFDKRGLHKPFKPSR